MYRNDTAGIAADSLLGWTTTRVSGLRSLVKHLEGVVPGAPDLAVVDPGHRHLLEGAGALDRPEVRCLPAKVLADLRYGRLGLRVVPADQHRRRAAREIGIDHIRVTDRV